MKLEATRKAYNKIFRVINTHKDFHIFDTLDLQQKSGLHLFGLELTEVYGLKIDPKRVYNFDWIDCGEYVKIGRYGQIHRRTISWEDADRQPIDEILVTLQFSTGPLMFGDGDFFNKDYPVVFFQKFWKELLKYNPDYRDSHNHCLYWKLKNAKEIFNSFNDILNKYIELNKEDIKQRRIEKMKLELAQLEKSK